MTDSSEPKKETARIAVSAHEGSLSITPARETARIRWPTGPPGSPPLGPIEAPSPVRACVGTTSASVTSPPAKKETAPITVPPAPLAKPAVQMEETQPLIDLPALEKPATALMVIPEPAGHALIDQVPMPLCWTLIAISAAVLILQIWTYLS